MTEQIFVLIEHFQGKVSDISYMLLAQAKHLASQTDTQVSAVLLGYEQESLAENLLADQVLYCSDPALKHFNWDAYLNTLTALIEEKQPRIFLFGETTIGSEIASGLSARLNKPTISFCKSLETEGDTIKFTCQICGGKLQASGVLGECTHLIAMLPGAFKVEDGKTETPAPITNFEPQTGEQRVKLKSYIEPESGDVDITIEPVLIGIGRGIENQDNIEVAEELAELLEGSVCASRPVIDQNWLPISRLVGKSGKTIKPKLYIALGISGAQEHIETILPGGLMIAVNNDPDAPIFNNAQYGVEEDLMDVCEALIEAIEEAKEA